jgi:hypothetical protein
MSRFEAVTVCLHYADFLEHSIRANQSHFDDWVVVTSKEDQDTLRVCERYGVRTALCPYFKKNASPSNKALAINLGLAHLKCSDWMIHIDADTVLPRNFRGLIENAEPRKDCIYGVDRVHCPTWDDWYRFLTAIEPDLKHYFVQSPGGWSMGTRLSHFEFGGYVPIGFFQMWNRESRITRYPTTQDGGAEHTDVLHSLQWARPNRVLLPEIIAIHLDSEPCQMGANWNGRTTKWFGPPGQDVSPRPASEPKPPRPDDSSTNFAATPGYFHSRDHCDKKHKHHHERSHRTGFC